MVQSSSSFTKVQHVVKLHRRTKHVPSHVAVFCEQIYHDQDTECRSMSQISSPSDFILAHPRDIALYWISLKGIATDPTSPILPRNVSFDENDILRTPPRLETTIPIRHVSAMAQRISLRPRKLPASVVRSNGVSLLPVLDAEASKLNTPTSISFVQMHDEEEQSGFATPERISPSLLDHRIPPLVIRRQVTTDDFLSSPRPVPYQLFIPDDF
jgi:hypothetical protein